MLKRFIQDTKKYFRYSIVAAKSQLKSEVADSYLNWIWWILDPLCFMLIYVFVFGYVLGTREPHFSVYIFIGLTMWTFFNKTIQGSVKAVKGNKALISKVYFPKYILLFTKIWVNGFKLAVSFCIVIIMIAVFRIPITWNVFYAIPILVVMGLLTLGISCFVMHWGVYVNDLSHVVSIVMRMMFYMTGIFFDLETRVPHIGPQLSLYNPMAFLLSSMRKCLIYSQTPNLKGLLVWFLISIALIVLGIRKIYKEENNYAKTI